MSELKPHLLFQSRGVLWGIAAEAVREVLLLPEIAPFDGAPWWVGVLDLRGRIIPVIELGEIAGAVPRRFQTTDHLIVVDSLNGQVGVIVEAVRDVLPLPESENAADGGAVRGLTRADGDIVRLLDVAFVTRFVLRETARTQVPPASPFCSEMSDSERTLFSQRARALQADTAGEEDDVAPSVVAVRVGGEIVGLDMQWVREFAEGLAITPVPGGPPDLLGLVNLRGEVVPLLDLRPALGLVLTEDVGSQITFIECEGARVGIAVQEVLDVLALRQRELLPPPAASGVSGDAIKSAVFYGGATLAVLDLHSLLERGGWTAGDTADLY